MPRYQRVRPKYGQSALHLSSGRENKQALSEAHETLHWDRLVWADCLRFESSQGTQIVILLSFYYPI